MAETTPKLLSVPEAAIRLGLTDRRVSKLCKEGRLGQRYGQKVYLIAEDQLEDFKRVPRPSGRPPAKNKTTKEPDEPTHSESLVWPVLNAAEDHRHLIEWRAWLKDGHTACNPAFKNRDSAIYGPYGAVKMFEGMSKAPTLKGRPCALFAVAHKNEKEVLVFLDRHYVHLIDREMLGDIPLADADPDQIRRACQDPTTQRMSVSEYQDYQGSNSLSH